MLMITLLSCRLEYELLCDKEMKFKWIIFLIGNLQKDKQGLFYLLVFLLSSLMITAV